MAHDFVRSRVGFFLLRGYSSHAIRRSICGKKEWFFIVWLLEDGFLTHEHFEHFECFEVWFPPGVTKPPLQTSRTALRHPIRFLLRCPNRRQNRRSYKRMFPTNIITCIVTLIPHVTYHVQSSRDSRLSHFHEVSELQSQPPPVSICKILSHASFLRCTVAQFAQLHSLHSRLRLKHSP